MPVNQREIKRQLPVRRHPCTRYRREQPVRAYHEHQIRRRYETSQSPSSVPSRRALLTFVPFMRRFVRFYSPALNESRTALSSRWSINDLSAVSIAFQNTRYRDESLSDRKSQLRRIRRSSTSRRRARVLEKLVEHHGVDRLSSRMWTDIDESFRPRIARLSSSLSRCKLPLHTISISIATSTGRKY